MRLNTLINLDSLLIIIYNKYDMCINFPIEIEGEN